MTPSRTFLARFTAAAGVPLLVAGLIPPQTPENFVPATWTALRTCAIFSPLGILWGWLLARHVRPLLFAAATVAGALLVSLMAAPFEPERVHHWVPAQAILGAVTGALMSALQARCTREPGAEMVWVLGNTAAWAAGYSLLALFGVLAAEWQGSQRYALQGAGGALAAMTIGGITGIAALKWTGAANERARRADETGQEHGG